MGFLFIGMNGLINSLEVSNSSFFDGFYLFLKSFQLLLLLQMSFLIQCLFINSRLLLFL